MYSLHCIVGVCDIQPVLSKICLASNAGGSCISGEDRVTKAAMSGSCLNNIIQEIETKLLEFNMTKNRIVLVMKSLNMLMLCSDLLYLLFCQRK